MAHVLAMRFSALGDVAMTVPVVRSFALAYPQHEVTLVSRPMAAPLFEDMPENVHFRAVNVNDYKGLNGLMRLYRELEAEGYDAVADLHDVLRTKLLRLRLGSGGRPTAHIRKGRKEKKRLTCPNHRQLQPLRTSVERYADVFARLGYPVTVDLETALPASGGSEPAKGPGKKEDGQRWIGVAPFARHKGKIYPLEQTAQVIRLLAQKPDCRLFLFGAGEQERQWCDTQAEGYDNVTSLVGQYNMKEELDLMGRLDVMICMDSANLHLASLAGTRTVVLWGATHPYAGFAALQRPGSRNLQLDMECRPCSIFGNKPCKNNEPYACLYGIAPETVEETVEEVLGIKK
jgi:ADP-heptose:LPS heptosyltransferase